MAKILPLDDASNAPQSTIDLTEDHAVFGTSQIGFDFRYVAALVRSNLLLIAAIIAAAVALAVIVTMLDTPRYTASTKIQINDTSQRVLNDQEDVQASYNDYDTDRFLKTQVDVLKSRGLAIRVAQKLKLIGNAQFYGAEEVAPPSSAATPTSLRELTIGLLMRHMKVDLPRDSRIVAISFESIDAAMSAQIANAYATEFIQSNLQRKFDSSSYARNFVADQLTESKQRLEESERALNNYSRSAGLIRTGGSDNGGSDGKSRTTGGSVTTDSLLQLNQAANEAKAQRIAAEGRWNAIASAPLLGSREVQGNVAISSLQTRKAEMEAALQEDSANHLADYPTVRAKQSQLAEINRQIQATAQNVRNSVRADYQAAADTERKLNEQVNGLKNATLSEQDRNVQYGLLAREADTNRQVYDGLLQRFKQLNASAGISLSNVSIIDDAEPPTGPSSPDLIKNIMVALLLGAGVAAVTVFLKDQFDDSIRVPEDIEQKLGLPLLGVIPRAPEEDPQAALNDPKSPISEAYNSMRGSLLYSTTEGLPHIMLITSAQPSEGKTTSSFAISAGLARMGKRVLLVDADMRRPSLHRRIGANNERGLSTLLTSHDPIESVTLPSEQANLTLVTSGPVPPSPTELLSSSRMEEVFGEFARKFDVVIVDSPPILGLADAPMMSALADGVIFVVESDRGRRGSLKTALRRLRAMRPILLGAVLTKFDPNKAGNRYSEYYGYEYYQYSTEASHKAS